MTSEQAAAIDSLRRQLDVLEAALVTTAEGPPRVALTVDEAAAAVGVSRTTITQWIGRGELPVCRPTKRPLILVDDLREFLRRYRSGHLYPLSARGRRPGSGRTTSMAS